MDVGALLQRARLWRLGTDEHVLCLAVHHCAFDEWSLDVLHAELSALYAAFCKASRHARADRPCSTRDVAAWQRGAWSPANCSPSWTTGSPSWRDAPEVLELPTDQPRPALQTYRGGRLGFAIDAGRWPRSSKSWAAARRHPLHDLPGGLPGACSTGSAQQTTVLVGTPIAEPCPRPSSSRCSGCSRTRW